MESNIRSISLPIPLILEEKLAGRSRFSFISSALSSLPSDPPCLHVISIAGSQSSGKSTLLNHAFSLNFPTMAPDKHGQTTKGMGLQLTNSYAFLDMEGSNSAERHAEDNSYLAKMIGAFGLLVSNLLIYNINILKIRDEPEVNHIANMMTHYLRVCNDKRKILFCIRDFAQGHDNLEDTLIKIKQTFNAAWDRAKVDSSNQILESVFEMEMITCSEYKRKKGKFENEEEVMTKFRDKVQEMLQHMNRFEVKNLTRLWSETWNKIDRNETIEFGKLVLKEAWEVLKQRLVFKCISLASEMPSNGDYTDKLNEYNTKIFNEIDKKYLDDKYARQALLTLYRQEFAKQAVYLDVKHFKRSIKNYFYSESEDTHTLYADLISIYEQIDRDASDRDRIRKSAYMEFLHESAKEQKLYINRIMQSLNSIYFISHQRIIQHLDKLNAADFIKINLNRNLSDLVAVPFALFSGIDAVLASNRLVLVAAEDASEKVSKAKKAKKDKKAIVTAAVTGVTAAATVAKLIIDTKTGVPMIVRGILATTGAIEVIEVIGAIGAIGATTTVGVISDLTKGTIWRDMAKEVIRSIKVNESFKITKQKLIRMLKISNNIN